MMDATFLSIADELARALPNIFCGHGLEQAWAYSYNQVSQSLLSSPFSLAFNALGPGGIPRSNSLALTPPGSQADQDTAAGGRSGIGVHADPACECATARFKVPSVHFAPFPVFGFSLHFVR